MVFELGDGCKRVVIEGPGDVEVVMETEVPIDPETAAYMCLKIHQGMLAQWN